jgi:hypothetical protein
VHELVTMCWVYMVVLEWYNLAFSLHASIVACNSPASVMSTKCKEGDSGLWKKKYPFIYIHLLQGIKLSNTHPPFPRLFNPDRLPTKVLRPRETKTPRCTAMHRYQRQKNACLIAPLDGMGRRRCTSECGT